MVVSLGFSGVNEAIKADFIERLPKFHKSRCEGLTLLSSIVLDVRSANLMELSAALPRHIGTKDHRYQYVSRVLSNSHIDCAEIMQAYAGDVFTRLASNGETIVLMMDQSHINDGHEVLMLSVGSAPGRGVIPTLARAEWSLARSSGEVRAGCWAA